MSATGAVRCDGPQWYAENRLAPTNARFYGGIYPFRFDRRGEAAAPTEVVVDEDADLIGRWSGTVVSPLGPLPTTIAITDSARATVTALSARDAAVQEFSAALGRVGGHFDVTVPGFGDFRVFLRLTVSAGKLQGQAYARGSFAEFPMSTVLTRD